MGRAPFTRNGERDGGNRGRRDRCVMYAREFRIRTGKRPPSRGGRTRFPRTAPKPGTVRGKPWKRVLPRQLGIHVIRRAVTRRESHPCCLMGDCPASITGLRLIYLKLDEKRAALAALEKALEINPHLPGARRKVQELHERLDGRKV